MRRKEGDLNQHPLGPEGKKPPPWIRSPVARYVAAILGIVVAWMIRTALDPYLHDLLPFLLFFAPILITGLYLGTGPAILAAGLAWFAGDWFFLTSRHTLLVGGASKIIGGLAFGVTSGVIVFVTHRLNQGRERLREAQERFQLFMDSAPTLAWVKDETGRYVYVNRAYEREFGVSFASLQGRTDDQLWGSETAARLRDADRTVLASSNPIELVEETVEPDGRISYWHNTKFSYRDRSGGRFVASLGVDVSSRKRLEDSLQRSEMRFRSFVEATNQVIWRTNPRGEADEPIPSWNAFTGQTEDESAGWGRFEAIHPEDRARAIQVWNAASAAKSIYETEYRLRRKDGKYRQMLVRGVPVLGGNGEVREYIGTCIDITAQRQAEEDVRRSERKFRSIFEQAAIGIGLVNFTDARWIEVNEPFCRSLGYSREFMLSTPWPQITHPEDIDIDLIPFRRMAAGELDSYSVEKRFLHRDGHPVWARLTLSLVRNSQGRPEYEIAIIENIEDRKRAEAQLQRQAQLIDLSPTATIGRSLESRITFWSEGAHALYGYTREEALGRLTHELLQTEFPVSLDDIVDHVRRSGRWTGELRQRTKEGLEITVDSRWLGQIGPDGQLEFLESNMDISARKKAEQSLVRERAFLEAVLQACPAGVIVADSDGKITRMNRANRLLWGLAPFSESVEGYREWKGWWADGSDRNGQRLEPREWALARALRGEICPGDIVEIEPFGAPGTRRTMMNSGAPVRGEQGEILGAVVAQADITSLKHTEAALRQRADELAIALRTRDQALAQLNSLLENAPLGFAFFDREHRYTRINDFLARKINGLPVEAHLGRPIHEVLPVNAKAVDPILESVFQSGKPVGNVVLTGETPVAPGQQRYWLTAWFPVRTPDGQIPWVGAVVLNITEQKQTELALQRRNQHLSVLHQVAADLLLGRRPVDLLQSLRNQLANTFGAEVFTFYEVPQEDGRFHLEACAGFSDEELQKLQTLRYGRAICAKPEEALHPIIATHIQTTEAPNRRFLRKLGLRSYLYYPLMLHNRLMGTVAFASRQRDEFDDADLEFFDTIAHTLSAALDRTRLESEVQKHASNLELLISQRTAKLEETVGELEGFSYSLIHDMRAPLRAIQTYASIIEDEHGSGLEPKVKQFLTKMRAAASRMDQLITDSFNYSLVLRQELPMEPVNVGDLLREIVETYPNLQPEQADVTIEVEDLIVHANKAALTQVFSNLLGNAVKFVAPGVKPRVHVWAQSRLVSGETAPRALIWVEDNGIGIPKESSGKIFGMFQRLHRANEYPGTGVGLAIVRKSLERMGGQVRFDSEIGRGSRFCVDLEKIKQDVPEREILHTSG